MEIDGNSVFHESDLLVPLLDLDKVSFLDENSSIGLVFFSTWATVRLEMATVCFTEVTPPYSASAP